jgi:hypothetical protein
MRIVAAGASGSPVAARRRPQPETVNPPRPEAVTGRALVPVVTPTPAAAAANLKVVRSAAFLAQLIATHAHLPQTRAKRRAGDVEAAAAYRATAAKEAGAPARLLCASI